MTQHMRLARILRSPSWFCSTRRATLCLMQSSRHSIESRFASELAVDLLEGCLERIRSASRMIGAKPFLIESRALSTTALARSYGYGETDGPGFWIHPPDRTEQPFCC